MLFLEITASLLYAPVGLELILSDRGNSIMDSDLHLLMIQTSSLSIKTIISGIY